MKPIDKVARQTVEPSWLLREGSQFMSGQTTGAWNAGPLSGHKCFCKQKKNYWSFHDVLHEAFQSGIIVSGEALPGKTAHQTKVLMKVSLIEIESGKSGA